MASTPPTEAEKKPGIKHGDPARDLETATGDAPSIGRGDILSQEHTDPVLNAKMHLVNNAIDEIGFTPYQWKLFVLNGFGYAVDSLILLIQSIIAGKAALEFHPGWANGLTVAAYVGMLAGASFWGEVLPSCGMKEGPRPEGGGVEIGNKLTGDRYHCGHYRQEVRVQRELDDLLYLCYRGGEQSELDCAWVVRVLEQFRRRGEFGA